MTYSNNDSCKGEDADGNNDYYNRHDSIKHDHDNYQPQQEP